MHTKRRISKIVRKGQGYRFMRIAIHLCTVQYILYFEEPRKNRGIRRKTSTCASVRV